MKDLGTPSVKFFKFEEYSRACFEFLPDSFVSRLSRCSNVSNTSRYCYLPSFLRPYLFVAGRRRLNFYEIKKTSIRFFNCQKSTTIFRPSFSIFLHLLCSSARKTVHWHWSANNFRFSERQLRRQLIFLCEKKEIWFFSQFREDYTFNSRTTPRRLVGSDTLRESLIARDNFAIFVAQGFWKFNRDIPENRD